MSEQQQPEPTANAGRHGGGKPTGKALLRATWALLRQDKELLWLPFIGAFFALVAGAIFFVPGFALGWLIAGEEADQTAYWIGLVVASFGATFVSIYFQAALVIGANERAEGRDPTRSSVLAAAKLRRKQILQWALLATTVGALLRLIQDRLGPVGSLLGALGGLAWTIATFLVVPVLVAEDVGPVSAVKRSASVLRETWGTSLRTTVRFGLIALVFWLPALALTALGLFLFAGDSGTASDTLGIALFALGVLSIIVLGTVFSAIGGYARALIYRYAMGQPTPGIDTQLIAGAFRVKGSSAGGVA